MKKPLFPVPFKFPKSIDRAIERFRKKLKNQSYRKELLQREKLCVKEFVAEEVATDQFITEGLATDEFIGDELI
jgi:hypothetical protein